MLCFSQFGSETRDLAILREFGSEAQVRVGNPVYRHMNTSMMFTSIIRFLLK